MNNKQFTQKIENPADITQLLHKYRDLGYVGAFGKKAIYIKRVNYHSSGGNNYITVILSKWEGTKKDLQDMGALIEDILINVAPHSARIAKLEHWTEEERANVQATRKYFEKYKICLDYIKKYILPNDIKFYNIIEFIKSDLYKSDEKAEYGYNSSSPEYITIRNKTYQSLIWFVDKNIIALKPKELTQ